MSTRDSLEQYYNNFSRISLHGESWNEPAQLVEPWDTTKILGISASLVAAIMLAVSFIPVSNKSPENNGKTETPALKTK